MLEAARVGLFNAAKATESRLKSNISLDDHNAEDLALLGHPYGFKHPSQIHDPDWLVHTKPSSPSSDVVYEDTGKPLFSDQTGRMLSAVRIVMEGDDRYAIGVDPAQVPYLIDVIEGTSKMRARNFPQGTLAQLKDEKVIYNTIERELKKELAK